MKKKYLKVVMAQVVQEKKCLTFESRVYYSLSELSKSYNEGVSEFLVDRVVEDLELLENKYSCDDNSIMQSFCYSLSRKLRWGCYEVLENDCVKKFIKRLSKSP